MILLVLALGVLAAYLAGGTPALVLHPLLSLISHGTSAGKIVFLLGYAAVFAALWALCVRQARNRPPAPATPPAPPGTFAFRLFAGALTLGMLASAVSFALYCSAYELWGESVTMHWQQGVNSANSPTHIHTSKVAIARTCDLLGFTSAHDRFDTGRAYVDVVPAWVAWTLALAFAGALITSLVAGPRLAARSRTPATGVLLAMSLGSLCKCVLDGGPLAYDAVAAGLCAWALWERAALDPTAWIVRRLPRLVCILGVWSIAIVLVNEGALIGQWWALLERLSLYLLIMAWPLVLPRLRRRPLHALCDSPMLTASLVGAGLMLATTIAGAVSRNIIPLFDAAPSSIVRLPAAPDPTLDKPELVADRVRVPTGATMGEAYRLLGERPNRVRRSSVLAGTSPVATGFFADLIVLRPERARIRFSPGSPVTIKRAAPSQNLAAAPGQRPLRRLRLQVHLSGPDVPVLYRDAPHTQIDENEKFAAYYLFDAHLRASGIEEYILVPRSAYRDRARPDHPAAQQTTDAGPWSSTHTTCCP
jgi:hypothetical protein